MRKPTFSPTRINAYLDCATLYRYLYLDRIGKFYMRSRPGFSFGSSLHRVLQEFHQNGAHADSHEMLADLESYWISAGYESAESEQEHQRQAKEIVSAYHRDFAALQEEYAGGIETIATEKTIRFDMGRFVLSGRVDRIDRYPNGMLEVVDYKSGRTDVSAEDVAASLAMNCYQLVLQKLYPGSAVRGTIYCLRSGARASYSLVGAAFADFEAEITEIVYQILDRDFEGVRPIKIDLCDTCDFVSRCRSYWRQEARELAARTEMGPESDVDREREYDD